MTSQGYYHTGTTPELVARAVQVAPLLTWDSNINGGVLRDRFIINGLVFEADPAYRAKSGLAVGGTVGSMLRYAWAEGRVVQLQAHAELAWSPRHQIGRGDAVISACSRNHLAGWTFLDFARQDSEHGAIWGRTARIGCRPNFPGSFPQARRCTRSACPFNVPQPPKRIRPGWPSRWFRSGASWLPMSR